MLQARTVGLFLKLEDVEVQICDMFDIHSFPVRARALLFWDGEGGGKKKKRWEVEE